MSIAEVTYIVYMLNGAILGVLITNEIKKMGSKKTDIIDSIFNALLKGSVIYFFLYCGYILHTNGQITLTIKTIEKNGTEKATTKADTTQITSPDN